MGWGGGPVGPLGPGRGVEGEGRGSRGTLGRAWSGRETTTPEVTVSATETGGSATRRTEVDPTPTPAGPDPLRPAETVGVSKDTFRTPLDPIRARLDSPLEGLRGPLRPADHKEDLSADGLGPRGTGKRTGTGHTLTPYV